MGHRIDLLRGLARRARRRPPGVEALASATAAGGDPAPLLELQAGRRRTTGRSLQSSRRTPWSH